jgi:hypothetical protein
MTWLGDRCTYAHMFLVGRERARDILSAHANCWPPCPRQKAARRYAATFALTRSSR